MTKSKKNLFMAAGLLMAGVVSRLLSHHYGLANIELLTSIALLSSYYLQGKARWIVPLLSVAISDVFLPSTHFITLFTWTAWALIGLSGQFLAKHDQKPGRSAARFVGVVVLILAVGSAGYVFSPTGSIANADAAYVVLGAVLAFALILEVSRSLRWQQAFAFGIASSFFFYLYTNFGVWLEGWGYPRDLGGLIDCYIKGLPFLERQLRGNLVLVPVSLLCVEVASYLIRAVRSRRSIRAVSAS